MKCNTCIFNQGSQCKHPANPKVKQLSRMFYPSAPRWCKGHKPNTIKPRLSWWEKMKKLYA